MRPAACRFVLAAWAALAASGCGKGWPVGVSVFPTPVPAPSFGDAPERGAPAGPSTGLSTASTPAAPPVPLSAGGPAGAGGGSVGASIGQAAAAVAAGVGVGVTAAAAATTFRCHPGADSPESSRKINLCAVQPGAPP